MPKICAILEPDYIVAYLEARGLVKQYQKAKRALLRGDTYSVFFKERKPKNSGVWSFRVNKQFRAFGALHSNGDLVVYRIDNHQ